MCGGKDEFCHVALGFVTILESMPRRHLNSRMRTSSLSTPKGSVALKCCSSDALDTGFGRLHMARKLIHFVCFDSRVCVTLAVASLAPVWGRSDHNGARGVLPHYGDAHHHPVVEGLQHGGEAIQSSEFTSVRRERERMHVSGHRNVVRHFPDVPLCRWQQYGDSPGRFAGRTWVAPSLFSGNVGKGR